MAECLCSRSGHRRPSSEPHSHALRGLEPNLDAPPPTTTIPAGAVTVALVPARPCVPTLPPWALLSQTLESPKHWGIQQPKALPASPSSPRLHESHQTEVRTATVVKSRRSGSSLVSVLGHSFRRQRRGGRLTAAPAQMSLKLVTTSLHGKRDVANEMEMLLWISWWPYVESQVFREEGGRTLDCRRGAGAVSAQTGGAKRPPAPEEARRGWPCPHLDPRPGKLISDFWPPEPCGCRSVVRSAAAEFAAICRSSPGKRMQVCDATARPAVRRRLPHGEASELGISPRTVGCPAEWRAEPRGAPPTRPADPASAH